MFSILEKIVIYFVCMVKLAYITPCLITQKNKDQSFYSFTTFVINNTFTMRHEERVGLHNITSDTLKNVVQITLKKLSIQKFSRIAPFPKIC